MVLIVYTARKRSFTYKQYVFGPLGSGSVVTVTDLYTLI
jgi:hypothetical protein